MVIVIGNQIERNAENDTHTEEIQKIPYPKRVFFIISSEFCERFNFNGFRAIFVIYLTLKLSYSENEATILYHGLVFAIYGMCLIGGIISDVWLGHIKTIMYLSIVYAIGTTIVSISSIPMIGFSPKVLLFIGLAFIAIGSGGIKPCVMVFGGTQFKLPEQSTQMASYFSYFILACCIGGLLSTIITPILREDVHCLGQEDCFPLAFGVPAILMTISVVLFLLGKSSYTINETSSENMLVQVMKCITNAISTKYRKGWKNSGESFLDYSINQYGEQLVNDIKALFRIIMIFSALPIFWALYEQQGSRWTFQAMAMDGNLGIYVVKPDQMQVFGPLLILMFVPIWNVVQKSTLSKIGIQRPLQKMAIGGILASVAFLCSALVQLQIESSPAKSVSIIWQLPQYMIMTIGEIMLIITGITFAYDEAPKSMKSVVMAFWLLANAIGNLFLVIIAATIHFQSQAYEFFLFSGLMFISMLFFIRFAHKYKSNTPNESVSNLSSNTHQNI